MHEIGKALDTVPHNILASQLEGHGLDGWATPWIRHWLAGCTHRVVLDVQVQGSDQRFSLSVSVGTSSIFVCDRDSGAEALSGSVVWSTGCREGMTHTGTWTGVRGGSV